MLTFMLLVVLGGGLGLLAVSLAESPKPATDGGRRRRAPDGENHLDAPPDEAVDDTVDDIGEQPMPVRLEPVEPGPLEPSPDQGLATVLSRPTSPPSSRRPPDPRRVPLAYTAVEGRYDTVAVAPLWRRLVSLAALMALALIIGVAVAAVAAAVFGALAEILNNAVG